LSRGYRAVITVDHLAPFVRCCALLTFDQPTNEKFAK
jgi:hypothetical protein